jgi:hypothetical protein
MPHEIKTPTATDIMAANPYHPQSKEWFAFNEGALFVMKIISMQL